MTDHTAIFEEVLNKVRAIFLKDGHLVPVVFVIKEEEWEIYAIASLADEKEKDALEKFLVQQADSGAKAIIFVSESWMVSGGPGPYKSVSEHPDRIEIVSAVYSSHNKEMMATAKINRVEYDPWAEEFVEFKPVKPDLEAWQINSGETKLAGRFCNLWAKARDQHTN